MRGMRGMWLRLVRLFRWRASERDIDEELRFHVDMETDAYVASQGIDRTEARRRALMAFGGQERWREQTRGTRGTGWLEDAVRDARFAVRALRRSPGFGLASLATIALGVGATTAIFSVVHGVVLAPLPYPNPHELVTVWMRNPAQGIEEDITSWPNFVDWRAQSTTIERMSVVRRLRAALTGAGEAEEVLGASVSRGFFELVGMPLAHGRGFRDEEVEGESADVVVLSHELFVRRFGADPSLVGRTIQLNDEAYEVIGVVAPGRAYPRDAELWTPLAFTPGIAAFRESRGALWLPVIGRLADRVDLAVAQNEMDAVARGLEEAFPAANEGVGIALEPLHETIVGDVRAPLLVLLGAVGVVLLIAVVNVANLLLARGMSRSRELALRLTLGAGRGRIVRQVLAESTVLGVLGGLAGTALASLAVAAMVGAAPVDLPRLDEVRTDGTVLAFAFVVALTASLFFGLVPALHAARSEPGSRIREGARGSTGGAGLARLRSAFVTAQFGLALLLLVGSGLLVRSFVNLRSVDPGFEPEGVLGASVSLPSSRYADDASLRSFHQQLEAELAALPGVVRVGTISTLFLGALPNMGGIAVEGRSDLAELARRNPVVQDVASADFFASAGMEIVAGRAFDETDVAEGVPVAVVNETFARLFFPGADPIGARFTWDAPGADATWFTVVGVAEDARRSGLERPVRPSAFLAATQFPSSRMDILVRTAGDPLAVASGLRAIVRRIDGQLPLTRLRTLEQAMSDSLGQRRFVAALLTLFAGSALALAAVGIFGVMAYVVGQRTREIGIRVALGAQRSTVLGEVLAQGMAYAGLGLAAGLGASIWLVRFVRSQLVGLEPTDPVTFAVAAVVLLGAAALACFVPARRAASVDPLSALREE